jgi:hypothetical protein
MNGMMFESLFGRRCGDHRPCRRPASGQRQETPGNRRLIGVCLGLFFDNLLISVGVEQTFGGVIPRELELEDPALAIGV